MTGLWFDRELGRLSRRGGMVHAAHHGTVWAVLVTDLVHPGDLAQESRELLGYLGAAAHGIGHLLLGDGVHLSAELADWGTAPDIPLAELGRWVPALISIDGSAQLALTRDFHGLRVFASIWSAQYLTLVTPSAEATATLVHRDDVPPPVEVHS
jgi:hypothetical protein